MNHTDKKVTYRTAASLGQTGMTRAVRRISTACGGLSGYSVGTRSSKINP